MKPRGLWSNVAWSIAIGLLLSACTITTPPQTLDFADLLSADGPLSTPIEEGVGAVPRDGLQSPPDLVERLGRGGVTLLGASVSGATLIEEGAPIASAPASAIAWTDASQLRVSIWLAPSSDPRDTNIPAFLVARGVVDLTPASPGRYVIDDAPLTVTEGPNDGILTDAIAAGTFDAYVEFEVLDDEGNLLDAYAGELTVDEFDVRVRFSIDLF